MASSLPTSSDYELDFFTAPTSVSPLSIEGSFDSLISATACLSQLKGQLPRWDGVSHSYLSRHAQRVLLLPMLLLTDTTRRQDYRVRTLIS